MRERILFVYNPNAGKQKIKEVLSEIINNFSEEDVELIVTPTHKRGDALEIVKEYERDPMCTRIACSGGDGTLHEVVNGMMKRTDKVPITYLPTGTTNDFAQSLHIPKDMVRAAELLRGGKTFPCDIGQFNDEYFVYTACFGVFTETSYATPQNMKNVLGHFAYVVNGMSELAKIQRYKFRVELDDEVIEDKFIFGMVCSTSSVGGVKGITGRDISFDDGLYEMILIREGKLYELPALLNDMVMGKISDNNQVVYKRVKHVKFTSEEVVPWCLDGEFGGNFKQVDINIHQQAVELMIDKGVEL